VTAFRRRAVALSRLPQQQSEHSFLILRGARWEQQEFKMRAGDYVLAHRAGHRCCPARRHCR
jgi:hypothetical protein